MLDRFKLFPQALASQTKNVRLGPNGVPAILAHPDWSTPAPVVLWMHGRTAYKELDPGRYLRWIRAGIAACAIDLPGHGERGEPGRDRPEATLNVLAQMIGEIDGIVAALADAQWNGVFDTMRMGIGGMSAGGMATLRRLCNPHLFACAAVECTAGNLRSLYGEENESAMASGRVARHEADAIARLDTMRHLEGWRPIPMLILHNELDRVIPIEGQRRFVEALRGRYAARGVSPSLVEFRAFPENGAPDEHAGFGKFGNEAKNTQVEFLKRCFFGAERGLPA
jgi:dienelactone hydrolase